MNLLNGNIPVQQAAAASKDETQMASQAATGALEEGAAAAKQAIDVYVAPNLDPVLQSEQYKQLMPSFVEDTQDTLAMTLDES